MPITVSLGFLVALSACGSGGSSSPKTGSQRRPTSVSYEQAGANPSVTAKMVCGKEVRDDIASVLGIREARVTTPTWADHVYSCTYVYGNGSIVLSVKELASAQTTTAYFDGLANKLGRSEALNGLGQGGFIGENNEVVVRTGYKVLLVDVHALSLVPTMSQRDVATNIAAAITDRWARE